MLTHAYFAYFLDCECWCTSPPVHGPARVSSPSRRLRKVCGGRRRGSHVEPCSNTGICLRFSIDDGSMPLMITIVRAVRMLSCTEDLAVVLGSDHAYKTQLLTDVKERSFPHPDCKPRSPGECADIQSKTSVLRDLREWWSAGPCNQLGPTFKEYQGSPELQGFHTWRRAEKFP